MAQEWTRIEGMIIGHDLDPSVVAGELKERSILAQLEWFPSSPQLLGLKSCLLHLLALLLELGKNVLKVHVVLADHAARVL